MFLLEEINADIVLEYKFSSEIENEFCYFKLQELLFLESKNLSSNNISISKNIELLAHIISLALDVKKSSENPYQPYCQFNGGRSFSVEDISPEHYPVIYNFIRITQNSALKARIFDLLWIRKTEKKNSDKLQFAKDAIDEYLNLIKKLSEPNVAYSCCCYFKRVIQIWKKIGSRTEIQEKITTLLIDCIKSYTSEPKDFMRAMFFEILPSCLDMKHFDYLIEQGDIFCKNRKNNHIMKMSTL